jgi:hypothetical protein
MSNEQGLNRYGESKVITELEKTSFEKIQDKRIGIGESIRVISVMTLNLHVSLLFRLECLQTCNVECILEHKKQNNRKALRLEIEKIARVGE